MMRMGAVHATVVVIESQPIFRDALTSVLSDEGMTILAATADGRDVVSAASFLTPDLILLSIGTPGNSDFDTLRSLNCKYPRAQIVTLLTGEMPWQEQAARDHGAHLVLTKSTPRSELLNAIKNMTGRCFFTANVQ